MVMTAPRAEALVLRLLLVFHFAVHGLAGFLGRELIGLFVLVGFHAVFESFDGAAEITTDIAQFFGAEYQQHNCEHHQPMPEAKTSHNHLLKIDAAFAVRSRPMQGPSNETLSATDCDGGHR
jgi:hypothetical protein